jgi:xanthine dehydrogenase accessory factor
MKLRLLARLQELRDAGVPVALVTRVTDGAQSLVNDDLEEGELALGDAARRGALDLLAADRCGSLDENLFVRVYQRPVRLIVVGAVHIAQALVRIAGIAGLRCTVIDPRAAFANSARFADTELVAKWPDQALAELAPDRRTAVVTLTHDPKLDEPALRVALQSEAFYVGALGSRKTHAARLGRLREGGVPEPQLSRIRAPVGLPLGGRRPAEIAISILAEIIQCLYGRAPA